MNTAITPPVDTIEYANHFPLQGKALYLWIFERNTHCIKAKNPDKAATNLQKILDATFKLSAKTSFHNMSLRDLSQEAGISMGGLYSYIGKKEDIALMVLDTIEHITQINHTLIDSEPDELRSLALAVELQLLTSTRLHSWFFFLYFETRCLNKQNQLRSTQMETNGIALLEKKIQQGQEKGTFSANNSYFIAHTIVIALQDWYLKPWKRKDNHIPLTDYSSSLFAMVKKLLGVDTPTLPLKIVLP